jgi:tetratricopeptide (TPR) repeat protein
MRTGNIKRGDVLILIAILMVASGIVSGCRAKGAFPDAAKVAPSEEDRLANAEPIFPLPRVAEEHPAPTGMPTNIDKAERAVADSPDDPKLNLELAFAYYQASSYADAAKTFEQTAQLRPKDPQPLLYLGYSQMAVGALNAAIKTFERVIALEGVSRDVQSEAYLQIGNAYGALGNQETAMKAFSQSLGNNPRQGLASLALGGWAAENKRYDQAKDFLTDAAKDLPEGRHKAQAYAGLGKISEIQKQRDAAITQYKKALRFDAENPWAKEGLQRLSQPNTPKKTTSPSTGA